MWRERCALLFGAMLEGISWILFALGGFSFLVGDKALYEFVHMDLASAEIVSLAAAVTFGFAGYAVRLLAGR